MVVDPGNTSLAGRVALVTGAAAGIGRAIALAYARFGADLALCDRNEAGVRETARLAERMGRRVAWGVLDVREPEPVTRFVAEVADTWERIDILVNNAGGTFRADFQQTNAKGQQSLIDENFNSVTHFIRAVLPHMLGDSGRSIINITSIEAHRAGPGFAIYSAMKAAVANLTKSLALELGDRNIRVNCIAPDVIPSEGAGEMDLRTPLARSGHVDDVAGAAVFLASGLSAFVTGTTIHVDGGNHAAGGWHRGSGNGFELG
jgi:3-oxoacyl-[acyl-carrier protein] reductase